MTKQQSKWNAEAELLMMGFTLPVLTEAQLRHLVGYILYTLQGQYSYDLEEKTDEVVYNALHKYNSEKETVKYVCCNATAFGTCLTFVRDVIDLSVEQTDALAWVENLDYPDCSELGYVFFETKHGKTRRIA